MGDPVAAPRRPFQSLRVTEEMPPLRRGESHPGSGAYRMVCERRRSGGKLPVLRPAAPNAAIPALRRVANANASAAAARAEGPPPRRTAVMMQAVRPPPVVGSGAPGEATDPNGWRAPKAPNVPKIPAPARDSAPALDAALDVPLDAALDGALDGALDVPLDAAAAPRGLEVPSEPGGELGFDFDEELFFDMPLAGEPCADGPGDAPSTEASSSSPSSPARAVEPRDAVFAFAGFGAPPRSIWAAPAFAFHVVRRRNRLHRELVAARARSSPDVALYEAALRTADASAVRKGFAVALGIAALVLLTLATAAEAFRVAL